MESEKVDYYEYIHSEEWKVIREEFLACYLFEGFCAVCGQERDFYNIHHITYKRLGEEYLEDLIALCGNCHKKLHEFHDLSDLNLYNASRVFVEQQRKNLGMSKYVWD